MMSSRIVDPIRVWLCESGDPVVWGRWDWLVRVLMCFGSVD